MQVSTYFKENTNARAEIHAEGTAGNHVVRYFGIDGSLIREEAYPGQSLHYVESAVNNWLDGIKVLNG